MSLDYYIQFIPYLTSSPESLDGGSLYAVSNVSFGATQTINIGSQSSGAGKAAFAPLNFTLGADQLTELLDNWMASGTAFQQVNLFAVDPSGATPVVEDTFKLVASKTDSIDVATGAHNLTMEYGDLVETSTTLTPDGGEGATATQGWNFVTNASDNDPTSPVQAGQAVSPTPSFNAANIAKSAASANQSDDVYVRINDFYGNVFGGTSGGWIAVDAASFANDQTLNIGSQSAGAGAGKITFDPLTLTFAPGVLEPQLFQDLAAGIGFQIEVASYSGGSLVDDYRFGTAGLAGYVHVVTNSAPAVTYTFGYGQEQITDYSLGANNPTTKGWDRVKNVNYSTVDAIKENAPATESGVQIAANATGEGQQTSYYIQFVPYVTSSPESLDGGSLYAVSNVSFGATQTINISSQSSGVGAGKVALSPLNFTLGADQLTELIDNALASGTAFQQVNLFAVDPNDAAPVVEDTFKLVASETDSIDIASGAHAITMEYGGLVETSTLQLPTGGQGAITTKGWNKVANVADNDPTAPVKSGQAVSPTPSFNAANIAISAASPSQTNDVYVRISDSSGNALGGASGGWIAVDAASFANNQTLNIGSQSSGAGAGHVTFAPLSLTFAPGALEPLLFQDLAAGASLQVEVASYGGGSLVDDYRFGTAGLASASDAVTNASPVFTYTFGYGQEQFTHYSQGASNPTTKGWDAVNKVNDSAVGAIPENAPSTESGLQVAANATGEGDQTSYYLQFIPYGGSSAVSLDGGSLYAVSNVSFGATQTLNIGTQSTGAGAVVLNPLNFTLGADQLTELLDNNLASGTPFQQVNLFAVNPNDTKPVAVDTFKLAASASDSIDIATGAHNFSLEYGGLVQTSTVQTSNGAQGASTTYGWNAVSNVADNIPTSPLPASGASGPAPTFNSANIATSAASSHQSNDLYVRLGYPSGTAVDGTLGGWISVEAATFANDQTLAIGSNGSGSGAVKFDPLSLTFAPGALEPILFHDLALGFLFQVEVASYSGGSLVDDYRFGTAALASDSDVVVNSTPAVTYTFGYGQEQITHYSPGAANPTTKGWDAVNGVNYSTVGAIPENAPTTEAAVEAQLATAVTGGTVVTAAQFMAERAILDASANEFYIADTAANVASVFDAASADTHLFEIKLTDAGTPALALTVAQALNDGSAIYKIGNTSYALNVVDAAATLQTVTAAQIQTLRSHGVLNIAAADGSVRYGFAPSAAIVAAGITITAPANDFARESFSSTSSVVYYFGAVDQLARRVSISGDSSENYFYGPAGSFRGVAYANYEVGFASGIRDNTYYFDAADDIVAYETFDASGGYAIYLGGDETLARTNHTDGSFDVHNFVNASGIIDGVAYTSFDVGFSKAGARQSEIYYDASDDVLATQNVHSNGGFELYLGATASPQTLAEQKTVDADGYSQVAFFNVPNQTYTSYQNDFTPAGVQVIHSFDNTNGTGQVNILGSGLTLTPALDEIGPGSHPADFAFTAHSSEIYNFLAGAANDSIDFAAGFGAATIKGFASGGAIGDVIDVSALFNSFAAAQGATTMSGNNAIINVSAHDTITVIGIGQSPLTARQLGFA